MDAVIQATKPEYEVAVDEYAAADALYQQAKDAYLSGDHLIEAITSGNGVDFIKQQHRLAYEHLTDLMSDRNAKLKTAKDKLRAAVVLAPTQQRGPDEKGAPIKYKKFAVSPRTSRWFDPKSLFDGCQEEGVLERLLSLTTKDDNGTEVPLVKQVWEIRYDDVLTWLRQNGLDQIVDRAYDEKEMTPVVTGGGKPVAALGEELKS